MGGGRHGAPQRGRLPGTSKRPSSDAGVLVQSRAVGPCATDVEMMTGAFTDPRRVHDPARSPRVRDTAGHEEGGSWGAPAPAGVAPDRPPSGPCNDISARFPENGALCA